MDQETKELLKTTLSLAEENNKMLHKLRNAQKIEFVWKVAKFVLVIGIALGSFYYLEPYLNKVMDMYNSVAGIQKDIKSATGSVKGAADNVKNITDAPNSLLQDILKKLP